jgi:hypothetical protein
MSDFPSPPSGPSSDGPWLPPPTTQPTPPVDKPKWWKRRFAKLPVWAWIAAAVLLMGAIGAATKKDEDKTVQPVSTSDPVTLTTVESTEPVDTDPPPTDAPTTTRATTTTTLPPTTTVPPTTAPPAPPIVVEGNGNQVVPLGQVIDSPHVVIASNDGNSNFIVYSLNDGLEELDLIANEIGPVISKGLVSADAPFSYLDVTAEGGWRLELIELEVAIASGVVASWDGAAPFQGLGNDIVL